MVLIVLGLIGFGVGGGFALGFRVVLMYGTILYVFIGYYFGYIRFGWLILGFGLVVGYLFGLVCIEWICLLAVCYLFL